MRHRGWILWTLAGAALCATGGCEFAKWVTGGGAGAPPSPEGGMPPQSEGEWIRYAVQWGLWLAGAAATYYVGGRRGRTRGYREGLYQPIPEGDDGSE